jgi:hypothetical protein
MYFKKLSSSFLPIITHNVPGREEAPKGLDGGLVRHGKCSFGH